MLHFPESEQWCYGKIEPHISLIERKIFTILAYLVLKEENRAIYFPLFVFAQNKTTTEIQTKPRPEAHASGSFPGGIKALRSMDGSTVHSPLDTLRRPFSS
jgi:hypothetical protein